MELERLIEEAQSAGTLDSSGRFTLDLERAWEKLARYSLERPVEFVLCLVRGVVGSGAASLRCEERGGQLTLEFPAEVPGLAQLFDRPFTEGETLWLRELAKGIFLGLTGGFASRAVLASGGEQLTVWLEGARPRSELTACGSTGPSTLVLTYRPRWVGPRLGGLVRQRCGLGPIPLTWNGRAVASEIPLKGLLGWKWLRASERLPGVGLRQFDNREPDAVGEDSLDAVICLASSGGFTVAVHQGVADHSRVELFPGARIWISARGTSVDLGGAVSFEGRTMEQVKSVLLDLALEQYERLTDEQRLRVVEEHPQAVQHGQDTLNLWPEKHRLRGQLVLALVQWRLRRRELAQADGLAGILQRHILPAPGPILSLPALWPRKAQPMDLSDLAMHLGDLAEEFPDHVLRWLDRLMKWMPWLRQNIAGPKLIELALAQQRCQLAEFLALMLLRVHLRDPHMGLGKATTLGMNARRYPEMCLLMRTQSPHSRPRRWEDLVRYVPPELRAQACEGAADSYRWAAQRYNDLQLFALTRNPKSFQWRGQYLKRADELYAAALDAGGDPERLRRARARAAALPLEGMAKAFQVFQRQQWRVTRDRQLARFLELTCDDPEVRLLEAEVRAELGELARASELLDGCEGLEASVERAIVQRLSGRDEEVELWGLLALPARAPTKLADMMSLREASRDMQPVPEGLAGRLIRLAELSPDPHRRLQLLRYALAVQFRFVDGYLDFSRPPSAALWLETF